MTKTGMDSDRFLANLRRSSLVAPERLNGVLEGLPPGGRAKTVARTLVKQGVLTRFQAELLLVGRSNGFVFGQYRILDYARQGRHGPGVQGRAPHHGTNRGSQGVGPPAHQDRKSARLFMREVRAAGKLMHPNIVTAHDANQVDGRHYLVMEYIDGPNLEQLVRERGPLPVGFVCDIVRQVARGCNTPTSRAWSIATSSRPTCLLQRRVPHCRRAISSRSSILAWPDWPMRMNGRDGARPGARIDRGHARLFVAGAGP